jgi:hypothetical protein
MTATLALAVELGLRDRFTQLVKRKAQAVATVFKQAAAEAGKGDAALTRWQKRAENFGSKLRFGSILAGAGLFAMTQGTADAGQRIGELSERTGFGAQELQEYGHAAKMAGVDTEVYESAIQSFGKRLGDLSRGQGKLKAILDQVAPSLRDQLLTARNTSEAFGLYLSAVNRVPGATKKLALASAAFGESGLGLVNLAEVGTEGIQALREEARRFGVLSEEQIRQAGEYGDAQDRVKASLFGVRNTIGTALMPTMMNLFGKLTTWIDNNRTEIQAWAEKWGNQLPTALDEFGKKASEAYNFAKPLLGWAIDFGEKIGPANFGLLVIAGTMGGPLVKSIAAVSKAMAFLTLVTISSPWGLAAAGIAALVGLIVYWGDITDWIGKKWGQLMDWLGFGDENGAAPTPTAAPPGIVGADIELPEGFDSLFPGSGAPGAGAMSNGTGFNGNGVLRIVFENVPAGVRVRPDAGAAQMMELDVGRAMGQ